MNVSTAALSKGRGLLFSLNRKKALRAEFERLAIPELSHLYRSAFYLTKDKTEVEDLVQETYLRAFRFINKFQPGINFRAWLLSIQRDLFINRYRKNRQEPKRADWKKIDQVYESIMERGEKKEKGKPEKHFFSQLLDEEVEKALRELPEEFRTAIVLVDIEELSYEEAAMVMECAKGTVRSRVSRGRRMLLVTLRDYALEKGPIRQTSH